MVLFRRFFPRVIFEFSFLVNDVCIDGADDARESERDMDMAHGATTPLESAQDADVGFAEGLWDGGFFLR